MEQIIVFMRISILNERHFFATASCKLISFGRKFHGSKNIGFGCCATPTCVIITSMPKTLCLQRLELRCPNELSFDGGSVRIKDMKTLYLTVVHSKHTRYYKFHRVALT